MTATGKASINLSAWVWLLF